MLKDEQYFCYIGGGDSRPLKNGHTFNLHSTCVNSVYVNNHCLLTCMEITRSVNRLTSKIYIFDENICLKKYY